MNRKLAPFAILLGALLSVYLPGPISGNFDINYECGCDGFHFYRITEGHAWIVSTTHEPPRYLGAVRFTNGVWRVPFNPLYQVRYPANPGLFWIDVGDRETDHPTRLWRKPEFWRTWPLLIKHRDFMKHPPSKPTDSEK